MPISKPIVAMTASVNAQGTSSGMGRAYHSSAVAVTQITETASIHGLRRPVWSAIDPKIGLKTAIATPATAMARLHCAAPVVGSAAMPLVK